MSDPETTETSTPFGIRRWFLRLGISSLLLLAIVAATTLLIALLAASRSITVPLIVAVAVAIVLTPLVNWMEKRSIGTSPPWEASSAVPLPCFSVYPKAASFSASSH